MLLKYVMSSESKQRLKILLKLFALIYYSWLRSLWDKCQEAEKKKKISFFENVINLFHKIGIEKSIVKELVSKSMCRYRTFLNDTQPYIYIVLGKLLKKKLKKVIHYKLLITTLKVQFDYITDYCI